MRLGKWSATNKIIVRRGKKTFSAYNCVCDCGTKSIIHARRLVTGKSTQCRECQWGEARSKRFRDENHKALNRRWHDMRRRCLDSKNSAWKNYGGRGIKVCDKWAQSFESFKIWALANEFDRSLTLERKNVNGNYSPQNCCWVTRKRQFSNMRKSIKIKWRGKHLHISEWARVTGIGAPTILWRFHQGWPAADIFLVRPSRGNNQLTRSAEL